MSTISRNMSDQQSSTQPQNEQIKLAVLIKSNSTVELSSPTGLIMPDGKVVNVPSKEESSNSSEKSADTNNIVTDFKYSLSCKCALLSSLLLKKRT